MQRQGINSLNWRVDGHFFSLETHLLATTSLHTVWFDFSVSWDTLWESSRTKWSVCLRVSCTRTSSGRHPSQTSRPHLFIKKSNLYFLWWNIKKLLFTLILIRNLWKLLSFYYWHSLMQTKSILKFKIRLHYKNILPLGVIFSLDGGWEGSGRSGSKYSSQYLYSEGLSTRPPSVWM